MPSCVAPSKRTALSTYVNHRQDCYAECDSVKSKNAVAVAAHVPHEYRDGQPSTDSGRDDTRHQLVGKSTSVQRLRTFEDDGRSDDGHAHQKAEFRRAFAIEAKSARRCNGGTRARNARDQRNYL